jgi:hypothetical protein
MRRGKCGILFYAWRMKPSEMTAVALAPRLEIIVFESLPQVMVEKGK